MRCLAEVDCSLSLSLSLRLAFFLGKRRRANVVFDSSSRASTHALLPAPRAHSPVPRTKRVDPSRNRQGKAATPCKDGAHETRNENVFCQKKTPLARLSRFSLPFKNAGRQLATPLSRPGRRQIRPFDLPSSFLRSAPQSRIGARCGGGTERSERGERAFRLFFFMPSETRVSFGRLPPPPQLLRAPPALARAERRIPLRAAFVSYL